MKLSLYHIVTTLQQTTLKTYRIFFLKLPLNDSTIIEQIENMMTKGEIARFEQFLLLSQFFQKSSAIDSSKSVDMRKRVISVYKLTCVNSCSVLLKSTQVNTSL